MNMTLKNKVFDLVLTEALKEYMDIELKEVDELVMEEPHELSPQFKKKMKKTINSVGRHDRIKKYKHIAVRAAVSVAAAFGLIFGALLTQPEVFAAVQNVFRNVFDKFDKYEYVGEEVTVDNFDNSYRLGYVPDGYYLSEGNYTLSYIMLTYTNETDDLIFEYGIANDLTAYYDNEHNSYYEFEYNGVEYYFYESNDSDFKNMIMWFEDGYSFSIVAHLSKEELVRIAENLDK
ncbi:MAG: DUF4367 domain-containing protein [Oscillospiraceae bacterium]